MAAEYDVLSEIEVLQSIYLDELQFASTCDGSWEVSLVLYPSTAEDSVSQFVRLTLKLTLDQQYPSSSPSISIHNPRGLSDDLLTSVCSCLRDEAESCLGSPVLYQLIEKAKEILTESNIPHGNCVICLYGFKEGEAFTKTSCYHYFHSHCLGRYVTHSEEELRQRQREAEQDKTQHRADQQELAVVCPVCREPLTYDAGQLLSSPAPLFPQQEGMQTGTGFREKWRELQELLERQKANGGIIDPYAESNRFLIHINEVPSEGQNGEQDAVADPGQAAPVASATPSEDVRTQGDRPQAAPWPCRGGTAHRRQGPRRGGRGRPHAAGRPSPPTESLHKLHLRSDQGGDRHPSSRAPLKAEPRGGPRAGHATTDEQGLADLTHGEPPDTPQTRPPAPGGPDRPAAAAEPGGPDQRGRRRGNRPGVSQQQQAGHWHERRARGTNNWDPQGPRHPHWEGRGSGGRGGGLRRGPSGGSHQRPVERDAGREEVL